MWKVEDSSHPSSKGAGSTLQKDLMRISFKREECVCPAFFDELERGVFY